MAVAHGLVGFVESVGLAAVAYGPNMQAMLDIHTKFSTRLLRNFWKTQHLIRLSHEASKRVNECSKEMTTTLTSLADGADLLITGLTFEGIAANAAEYHDIPLAELHLFPVRANGQVLPLLPPPFGRAAMRIDEWLGWRQLKKVENAQRCEMGLTEGNSPPVAADRQTRITGNRGLR